MRYCWTLNQSGIAPKRCLSCDATFTPTPVLLALKVDGHTVGALCWECLTPDVREGLKREYEVSIALGLA